MNGLQLTGMAGCRRHGLTARRLRRRRWRAAALAATGRGKGAKFSSCADLASRISYPNTIITAVNDIAAGTLVIAGKPVPRHCQVTGQMFQRLSPVDGKSYAIGFAACAAPPVRAAQAIRGSQSKQRAQI